jgi:hypothetical protein
LRKCIKRKETEKAFVIPIGNNVYNIFKCYLFMFRFGFSCFVIMHKKSTLIHASISHLAEPDFDTVTSIMDADKIFTNRILSLYL